MKTKTKITTKTKNKNNKYTFLNLDPIENAKSLGWLLIILGIFEAFKIPGYYNSYTSGIMTMLDLYSKLFQPMFYVLVGFGLQNKKVWSLYLLLIQIVFEFLYNVIIFSKGEMMTTVFSVSMLLNIALFLWLFTVRDRFTR